MKTQSLHPNRIDRLGQRFGRLVVTAVAPHKNNYPAWVCICDCGQTTVVRASSLVQGLTTSCGCRQREGLHVTHGLSRKYPREYAIWKGMKRRCYSPTCHSYKNYGGRGITVSDEWRTDFAQFLKDMGTRPSPTHSVDRIDVNGPYSADNCRWATPKEQANNQRVRTGTLSNAQVRRLRAIYHTGSYTLKELAAQFGVSESTVSALGRNLRRLAA